MVFINYSMRFQWDGYEFNKDEKRLTNEAFLSVLQNLFRVSFSLFRKSQQQFVYSDLFIDISNREKSLRSAYATYLKHLTYYSIIAMNVTIVTSKGG